MDFLRAVEFATPQIEADKRLLQFKTYDDYLDSLVTAEDLCYLQNTVVARTLAELGYRSSGETLSKESFKKRLDAVLEYMFPTIRPYELLSEKIKLTDPLIQDLALRERSNRVGILATIIFVRHYTKKGFEISGYIDYAQRLKTEDWKPIFKGTKKIWPKATDLGYYHWRIGKVVSNDSLNYKVVIDPEKGMLFQNRFDRKIINVNPTAIVGSNTTRTRIKSHMYDQFILYDHVVRQRI
ncbi:uncharacterized protein C4orf22 homolog [Agrilus planipennis]|uniref:Cilia- and flagella-associated protein 299 n=1 Tax=Agrilus planipennis TaxID=224129 RepID=A0A7F5RJV5_AGRPL|nr:uncharacterized protein C4orf22 homolog [Agrilus planipennis]